MHKVTISLDAKAFFTLETYAKKRGVAPECYASQIVHKSLAAHTIDYEDMAKGYESMADINLELTGGKTE